MLRGMVRGLSDGQIAEQQGITLATVKFHLRSICGKLGTSTRAETIAYAVKNHLVPDD